MAITVNGVSVPQQSKTLDTTEVTTGFGIVQRQIIGIADPENQSQYARLTGTSLNVNVTNASVAISAVSLPLPTGAATAAKQPALGIAGTASTDVLTVQGISSMTALLVDGSAVTQPVSIGSTVTVTGTGGTFPVTDSGGSLTVDDGGSSLTVDGTVGISGSVAVTGTFWQATQPVSASSLPLPTGAATAAKQPDFGTAGTPSPDVLTVQGISGGEPLIVDVIQPIITTPASSPYLHLNANGTTTVKSGAGVLRRIVINTRGGLLNTLTIYDNTTATGAVIAVIDTAAAGGEFGYELDFTTGLTVVLASGTAADITIIYE